MTIDVSDEGRVSLTDAISARRVASMLDFTDETDVGDLYTPAPRARQFTVAFEGARLVHRGPLRGELALRYAIVHVSASRPRTSAKITVNLIVDAGARFLRINVSGENRGHDHRVRMVARSDVERPRCWADAAFGSVLREVIHVPPEDGATETPPPTAPLHRYVSLFDADRGMTLFSDGLAEYESRDDGAILVTLVRAVGELSKNNVSERPGHAGWPRPTPAAQCIGPFAGEFAVMLHGPRDHATVDEIERTADDVLCPITGTTLRSSLGVPAAQPGTTLSGAGLAMSAIKESEDGGWIVLRCVNLLDTPVDGCWTAPFDLAEARSTRLDETLVSKLSTSGRSVSFVAGPHEIVTVEVR